MVKLDYLWEGSSYFGRDMYLQGIHFQGIQRENKQNIIRTSRYLPKNLIMIDDLWNWWELVESVEYLWLLVVWSWIWLVMNMAMPRSEARTGRRDFGLILANLLSWLPPARTISYHCICLNCKMYLFEMKNIFVWLWLCSYCTMYLLVCVFGLILLTCSREFLHPGKYHTKYICLD